MTQCFLSPRSSAESKKKCFLKVLDPKWFAYVSTLGILDPQHSEMACLRQDELAKFYKRSSEKGLCFRSKVSGQERQDNKWEEEA